MRIVCCNSCHNEAERYLLNNVIKIKAVLSSLEVAFLLIEYMETKIATKETAAELGSWFNYFSGRRFCVGSFAAWFDFAHGFFIYYFVFVIPLWQ